MAPGQRWEEELSVASPPLARLFPPDDPYCDQTWFVLFQSNYLCGLAWEHWGAPGLSKHTGVPLHTSPVWWSLFKVRRNIKMSILSWDLRPTHNNRPWQSFYYNAGKLGKKRLLISTASYTLQSTVCVLFFWVLTSDQGSSSQQCRDKHTIWVCLPFREYLPIKIDLSESSLLLWGIQFVAFQGQNPS